LGFQTSKKNDSILKRKWPRNEPDIKDDPYEAPVLACKMEMDQLTKANTISNETEEKDFTTCPNGEMTKLDDKNKKMVLETTQKLPSHMKKRGSTELVTPIIEMGSNDASITLKFFGSTQYVHH